MSGYTIASGQTETFHLTSGEFLFVMSGGTSHASTIGSGALAYVESGGLGLDDVISSRGYEQVDVGGVASGVQVLFGGLLTLNGTAEDTVVSSGGALDFVRSVSSGEVYDIDPALRQVETISGVTVESGGTVGLIQATIASGAIVSIHGGAALAGIVDVQKGGVLTGPGKIETPPFAGDNPTPDFGQNLDEGVISDVFLSGSFLGVPSLEVASGGRLISSTLVTALVVVDSGGRAESTDVDAGGRLTVDMGGVASGNVIEAKGAGFPYETVQSDGGVDSATAVASGGVEEVVSGGRSYETVVAGLGQQIVDLGGKTVGAVVLSGGVEQLGSGGVAQQVTVSSGGTLDLGLIKQGQTITATSTALGSARTLQGVTVKAGGAIGVTSAVLVDGGHLVLGQGDVYAGSATVISGGLLIGPGAIAGGAVIVRDGQIQSLTVSASTSHGGSLDLGSGAIAKHVTIGIDGEISVGRGAEAIDTVVSGDVHVAPTAYIAAGGVAIATTVVQGSLWASAGAVLSGLTISSGGSFEGSAALYGVGKIAGIAEILSVASGGHLIVSSGGYVGGTIRSGAVMSILSGGESGDDIALGGAVIDNGVFECGDTASTTLYGDISGDGSIVVFHGADYKFAGNLTKFRGLITQSDGTVELASIVGGGAFEFNPSALTSVTLQLDSAAAPTTGATLAVALSDFTRTEDMLDLRDVNFVKGATATVSGSYLTLADGSYTARFHLTGAIAANFQVLQDGKGGTWVRPMATSGDALIEASTAFKGGSYPQLADLALKSAPNWASRPAEMAAAFLDWGDRRPL